VAWPAPAAARTRPSARNLDLKSGRWTVRLPARVLGSPRPTSIPPPPGTSSSPTRWPGRRGLPCRASRWPGCAGSIRRDRHCAGAAQPAPPGGGKRRRRAGPSGASAAPWRRRGRRPARWWRWAVWFTEKERDGLLFIGEKGAPIYQHSTAKHQRKLAQSIDEEVRQQLRESSAGRQQAREA
jgi:hypothetical protein